MSFHSLFKTVFDEHYQKKKNDYQKKKLVAEIFLTWEHKCTETKFSKTKNYISGMSYCQRIPYHKVSSVDMGKSQPVLL